MMDDRVRIATALSNAGLSERAVNAEVLFMLPRTFTDAYFELFVEAWGLTPISASSGGGVREDRSDGGTGTQTKNKESAAMSFGVRDRAALGRKSKVDRKLRNLAREIKGLMAGKEKGDTRVCSNERRGMNGGRGCGKFCEDSWLFCPWCGSRTQEMDLS